MTSVKVSDAGGATINMVDLGGGFKQPSFYRDPSETKQIFESLPNFKFRNDDIMLCTFPKTGTNWMYEILMMILNRSSKRLKSLKNFFMLEAVTAEELDARRSPRVLNSHYPLRFLPLKDMKAKQIKTVLCVRNPKDTAVSYYNHMIGVKLYDYNGHWNDWLPVYLEGKLEYGKYTDYLQEWERHIFQDRNAFPLHIMYFEDLKMDGMKEIDKLLKFLNVELDHGMKTEIIQNCGFHQMAHEKIPKDMNDLFFKQKFKFFRKGQIGDWRNWFTVSQNDKFDRMWNREMKDCRLFNFTYHDADSKL